MDNDKIKEHFKKHKKAYIIGGVIFAEITLIIVRGRYAGARGGLETSTEVNTSSNLERGVSTQPLSILSDNVTHGDYSPITSIVNVLEREGRGHPGYLLYCPELDRIFRSGVEASQETGIPQGVISGVVTGKFPDADGLHFKRIATVIPILA